MAVPLRAPSVFVQDGVVVITYLGVRDPELAALITDADNPIQMAVDVLGMGSRAIRLTQASVDSAMVEQRFGLLEQRLDQGVAKAVELIGNTASAYLDPESGVLKQLLEELEANLDETFDPDNKAGILAKFEGILTGGTADLKRVVRDMVDPGNRESPLGRLRLEMAGEMKEVRHAVDGLRAQFAVRQTEADVLELTAVKGRRYEELAFEAIASFVSHYGDEVEAVGDSNGDQANRRGDVLVTLSAADTSGSDARYVVEAKDKKLSVREALNELDAAIKNRGAKAGVMVFSSQAKAPIRVPVQLFGSKVIAVFDKDEQDERPLRLALAAARCAVQRQLQHPVDNVADLDSALELVAEGQRALAAHSAIKRCHTSAKRQLEGAAGEVAGLVERLDDVLGQIAARLRTGNREK